MAYLHSEFVHYHIVEEYQAILEIPFKLRKTYFVIIKTITTIAKYPKD